MCNIDGKKDVHIPVLKNEAIKYLNIKKGGYYLDGTIGCAGHTISMLEKVKGDIFVLGVDRDKEVLDIARKNIEQKGYLSKVMLFHSRFSKVFDIIDSLKWPKLDGVLLDLGVSSYQVDTPNRGFSFHLPGPLDMRMDTDDEKSCFDIVNFAPYEELRDIIKEYGQDPMAGRIAKKIVERRRQGSIKTTQELASIVLEAYPLKWRRTAKRHPATRTFQALRIAVNRELDELKEFLSRVLDILKPGARIVIISFHSLEDRIVKHFFKMEQKDCICPPSQMVCTCNHVQRLKILTKKPVVPSDDEIELNKRARSAKLRAAEVL